MRGFLALTAVILAVWGVFAFVTREPNRELTMGLSRISDLRVVSPSTLVYDNDPKFPAPRPVHLVEGITFEIFARTENVERLDVLVQLSGTESFGVFSGRPDLNGLVRVEVTLPAGGDIHYWRMPGPEGRREPGPVRPGMVFMLAPSGVVSEGARGGNAVSHREEIVVRGEAIWVKVDE